METELDVSLTSVSNESQQWPWESSMKKVSNQFGDQSISVLIHPLFSRSLTFSRLKWFGSVNMSIPRQDACNNDQTNPIYTSVFFLLQVTYIPALVKVSMNDICPIYPQLSMNKIYVRCPMILDYRTHPQTIASEQRKEHSKEDSLSFLRVHAVGMDMLF